MGLRDTGFPFERVWGFSLREFEKNERNEMDPNDPKNIMQILEGEITHLPLLKSLILKVKANDLPITLMPLKQ